MQLGHYADHLPVDLFWHGAVVGPESGFDVNDRNVEEGSGLRGRGGRVRVALHDDRGWSFVGETLGELVDDRGELVPA